MTGLSPTAVIDRSSPTDMPLRVALVVDHVEPARVTVVSVAYCGA
jgi:hypothetical protein